MSHRVSITSHLVAAPSFGPGNEITVPASVDVRLVYGTISITATAGVGALVSAEVETGVGTDTYDEVMEARVALGLLQNQRWPFSFAVEGGRRYRFMRSDGVGVTETVLRYSYADL